MQQPTKAFADMMLELADRLQAVLTEIHPDGNNQGSLIVSPDSLRAAGRHYAALAEQRRVEILAQMKKFQAERRPPQ